MGLCHAVEHFMSFHYGYSGQETKKASTVNFHISKTNAIFALHFHRQGHLPGLGRSPGLDVVLRLAPRTPEQLGPAGIPCATPGDTDHCRETDRKL